MYIVLIVVSKLANPCEKTTSLWFPICLPTGSFMLNPLLHFLPLSCQQLYFIGDCCSIELEVRVAALPGKQYFILYITSQCIESGKLVISHFISSIIYYAEVIMLSAAVESGMWYVLYLKDSLCFCVLSQVRQIHITFPKQLCSSWSPHFIALPKEQWLTVFQKKNVSTERHNWDLCKSTGGFF